MCVWAEEDIFTEGNAAIYLLPYLDPKHQFCLWFCLAEWHLFQLHKRRQWKSHCSRVPSTVFLQDDMETAWTWHRQDGAFLCWQKSAKDNLHATQHICKMWSCKHYRGSASSWHISACLEKEGLHHPNTDFSHKKDESLLSQTPPDLLHFRTN